MAEDKSKEILEHLTTWLSRQKKAATIVPQVQRLKEEAEWQRQTLVDLKSSMPSEVANGVEKRLDRAYGLIKSGIPLPPDYSSSEIATATTSMANSTSSTYGGILRIEDLSYISPEKSKPYLFSYSALQEKYNRQSEVKKLLERKLPSLLSQFDRAVSAYETAKSQPEQIPTAALELRTLLDNFKGELFKRARHHPKENMSWEVMAERIGVIPNPMTSKQLIQDQDSDRAQIIERLSNLIKRRKQLKILELELLLPLVLDHLFVVCESIGD